MTPARTRPMALKYDDEEEFMSGDYSAEIDRSSKGVVAPRCSHARQEKGVEADLDAKEASFICLILAEYTFVRL